MKEALLEQLRKITDEEAAILRGGSSVERSLYSSGHEFIIDSKKMMEKGKLINIRTHTRFVHFPKHTHNFVEIIYMCSGTTTHIINDTSTVVLEQGDLLILNQNAVQEILPAGENDIAVNFMILPEFFNVAFTMMEEENAIRRFLIDSLQQKKGGAEYIYFQVADVLPVQNLMENLIWSLLNKQPNKYNINQTTMGLLFLQLSNYTDRISRNESNQYEQGLVYTVLRYVDEQYKSGTLQELSEMLKLSTPWLSRFIKQKTGSTFKELLMQRRLQQAVYLLSFSKLPVEEIIAAVGYDNSSYFHRLFKERYHRTPKQYRDNRTPNTRL